MKPTSTTLLHLIDTAGPGGAETVLATLVERLDAERWHHVVALPEAGWLQRRLQSIGICPVIMPKTGPFDLGYLRQILHLVRRHRVALVQTHLFTTAVYASVAARLSGVPVVSTIHGHIDIGPPGPLRSVKFRLLNRERSRLVFVSNALRREVTHAEPIREERVTVVPNGVDVSEFRPRASVPFRKRHGLPADSVVVGALGNVRASKDYATLMRAAALIRERWPRHVFVVAGDTEGDPELFRSLLALRESLGLPESCFRFVGFSPDAATVLNAFDIYVMSSSNEGLPLALLQAMASGRPVVATRCGGPQELIREGETGLLVPSRDPVALAEAIGRVSGNPERAAALGANARHYVERHYALDATIGRYEALYRELLQVSH